MNLPDAEPFLSRTARAITSALVRLAAGDARGTRPIFLAEINGHPATDHPFQAFLDSAAFVRDGQGFRVRPPSVRAASRDDGPADAADADADDEDALEDAAGA